MALEHEDLESVHRFAHVSESDPGAVGALKGWIDTSLDPPALKYRSADNTEWKEVISDTSNVKLLQKTTWDLRTNTSILAVPDGKNAIIDKICLVALGDINEEVGGGTLVLTDTFTSNDLFDYIGTSNEWDNFAFGSGGMASTGITVTFKGFYNSTTHRYYDFPAISEEIIAECTVTPAEEVLVLVLVYGHLIDAVY